MSPLRDGFPRGGRRREASRFYERASTPVMINA
jgi:hypothetical protein